MFSKLIAALAVTAFGLTAIPAEANTSRRYQMSFAAGALAAATCDYMSGESTADEAAEVMKNVLIEKGVPLEYGNSPVVAKWATTWIKTNGCS